MDRRSWLWGRKSSEKNPNGETESSGSASSNSGRFSDEQTPSNQNTQSPEVTSKVAVDDELNDDSVNKTLSEKLSEALLQIRAKEDSVKQHAKVAEEAVSGWERAENEVSVMKKQVDVLTHKNSILEERVGHLDGALKECLRQLRQAREEQEEKIYDAVTKKTSEWESTKSQLKNEILELNSQLQNAKTDSKFDDFRSKLEAAGKENLNLKLKLLFKSEELELSTRAAEMASKQHLDSLKKVAKLEAEFRTFKAVAHKAAIANDHRSVTASSIYAESLTDGLSDSCKMDGCRLRLFENERKNFDVPSVEIDFMDDFLEMEKLATLPKPDRGIIYEESCSREMEVMINRTCELEEKLNKLETERFNLEIKLNECQNQLMASEDQFKRTQETVVDLSGQLALANESKRVAEKEVDFTKVNLKNSIKLLDEKEVNLMEVQNELKNANEAKGMIKLELKNANLKKIEAETKVKVMELELQRLQSNICTLEDEANKEIKFSKEVLAKCEVLDNEISRMKSVSQFQRSIIVDEFRINQDKELAVAAGKFAECQNTIASLGRQLKSLTTLEDLFIDSKKPATVF